MTDAPFGSFDRQPRIHIEFETAVRIHMIPNQGSQVSWVNLSAHFGCASTFWSMERVDMK
jgi:hypothetical protein